MARAMYRYPAAGIGLLVTVILTGACSGVDSMTSLEFAGTECVIDLPASLQAGDHAFELTNTSDRTSLPVYVVRLSDGHSYSEFAALQPAPGDYFVLPKWAEFALRGFADSEASDSGMRRFVFSLEPGVHAVYVWASRPAAIWLCGPIRVTS